MKTLSFHDLQIGRSRSKVLLRQDTQSDHLTLKPGLNLIVAPNGYGKTTLLQTLGGVLKPIQGEARLDGKTLNCERDVLYVSEYLTFPKFVYPAEWIEFISPGSTVEQLQPWIEGFRLKERMGGFLGRLSQGERRKVTWLGAHTSQKPVLLLDEPLDGLDLLAIRAARDMVNAWRKEQRIVCVVAHQVGEVLDLSDEVLLIREQKLIQWSSCFERPATELPPADFRSKVLEYYL